MPSYANTNTLTAHCEAVATITGTVGWEAVRKGKKAIVFGHTWYSSFPGVFKWSDGLNYSDIENYQIDHGELEQIAGQLLETCHDGVIERHYIKIDEGHDVKKNIQSVSSVIFKLLKNQQKKTFV
jgi:hypothetical protein